MKLRVCWWVGSQISANCPKFTRLFFGGLPLGPEMIMFVLNFEDQGGTVESQRKVFVRFTTFVKFASAAVPIHSYTAPKISLVKLVVDDNWSLMQILCVCQGWVVGWLGPRLYTFVRIFLFNLFLCVYQRGDQDFLLLYISSS